MVEPAVLPTMAESGGEPGRGLTAHGSRLAVATSLLVLLGVLPAAAQTTTTNSTTPSSTSSPSSTSAPSSTASTSPTSSTSSPSSTATTTPAGTSTTATTAGGTNADERQKLEQAQAENARELDVADARLEEVTEAMASVQDEIEAQGVRVELAGKRLAEARAVAAGAAEQMAELEAEVAALEAAVGQQAVQAFKGDNLGGAVMVSQNPNRALRMQTMLAKATRSDIDLVSTLAAVREDLRLRRAQADEAVADAERLRLENEEELAKLEEDRLAQGQLAAAAEQRLDHLLSERAGLAALGERLDTGTEIQQALVDELAKVPPPPAPASDSTPPPDTGNLDIRPAGKGIMVHVEIVEAVRQLLIDAAADGVDLAGGGYRDPASQIAVRRNNCGTSNYAIYEMPASRCRPPTARPGRSMHEQGKAIDFTYNGRLIRSRSGSGWNWLAANAARYGLRNLPSEPWHWSTNGR